MPRDVLVVVSSPTLGDAKYRDVCVMSVCPFVRRRFRWEQVRVVHGLGWVKQNGPMDNSGTGGNRFAENEGVMPGMKE